MKTPNMPGIVSYPVDFMITCGLRQVRPEVYLQHFVNELYYSAMFCETRSKIEFGVNVIVYRHFINDLDRVPLEKHKALHRMCKEQLDEIIDDPATVESTKRELLVPVLRKFKEAICQDPDQVSHIGLPNGCILELSDSMIVICFLYGVLPERIIKSLIDDTSITMQYAQDKLGYDGENYYMETFNRITQDLLQDSAVLNDRKFCGYEEMLKEIYYHMREELDIKIRYNRFRIHFRKWHNSLKHIEIKPIIL